MMILAKAVFKPVRNRNRTLIEDAAEWYLICLARQGQIDSDFLFGWKGGALHAHVNIAAPDAMSQTHHSSHAKTAFKKVVRLCGRKPVWKILEDQYPKTAPTWEGAPFLYLHTSWEEPDSPIRRGDTGEPIAPYLLGYPEEGSAEYHWYGWRRGYEQFDEIWIASGVLEIPAYRQLAEPRSELSKEGRGVCWVVEKLTGIPTYYYLKRYYGRKRGESRRVCPGCGGAWRRRVPARARRKFWHFPFRCDACRLVSHDACDDSEPEHAGIGEFRPRKGRG